MNEVKNRTAVNRLQGDYEENGVLMCGKCHTPKECVTFTNGIKGKWPVLCRCEEERKKAEQAVRDKIQRDSRIRERRDSCFRFKKMQSWTFKNDDLSNKKLTAVAHDFVDSFSRKCPGLLIFGPVGTGKSYIAAAIANELLDKGFTCYCTTFSTVANEMLEKIDSKQSYIDSLTRFDLLVIDDLAAERDTKYMNEVVFDVINSRYLTGKPLIVTTNLSINELQNPQEQNWQRVISRLKEMCKFIPVDGKDRRHEKLLERYAAKED